MQYLDQITFLESNIMNIEQIKTELLALGFTAVTNLPKFDQYTGEKLPVEDQVYKLSIKLPIGEQVEFTVKIELDTRFGSNGVLNNIKYGGNLFINDLETIEPFWDLFIKLVDEKIKNTGVM